MEITSVRPGKNRKHQLLLDKHADDSQSTTDSETADRQATTIAA
jgi:hypothetical protein